MKLPGLFSIFLFLFYFACGETQQPQHSPEPPACIGRIIAADDSLGAVRNHASETISLSESIRNYAAGLKKLDFRDCPPAFTKAFENHRQAWLAMVPFVERFPEMRGEMHELFEQLEKGEQAAEFRPLLKAIWDTWEEVESAME